MQVLFKGRLAVLLVVLCSATVAPASLIRVTGHGLKLDSSQPGLTGATPGFFHDESGKPRIRAWDERQNFRLPRDIAVDIIDTGSYRESFDAKPSYLPEGLRINSHLIYFDPVSQTKESATFTFSHDILALIVLSDGKTDHLALTDFLGMPQTTYPVGHLDHRGIEFGSDDQIVFDSRRSLTVTLKGANPGDQIRVITRSGPLPIPPPPIPEPASIGLALVAGSLLALGRGSRRGES